MSHVYTIKEAASRFDLPISTIHYYDKKGLLPFVAKNAAGHRVFTESDLSLLQTICCLKNTGMPIKEISCYIHYCMQGSDTIELRKEMLKKHQKHVIGQQLEIQRNLHEINKKIRRYESADAKLLIDSYIQYAAAEKERQHLPNPYADAH